MNPAPSKHSSIFKEIKDVERIRLFVNKKEGTG